MLGSGNFFKVDHGHAKCNFCKDNYACPGNKFSNLWKHLRSMHSAELRTANKRKEMDPDVSDVELGGKGTDNRTGKVGFDQKQSDDLLVALICNSYLPFCLVENPIMIKFVPTSKLPPAITCSPQQLHGAGIF